MNRNNLISTAVGFLSLCSLAASSPLAMTAQTKEIIYGKALTAEMKSGLDKTFFTPSYAEVRGKIEDYNPKSGLKNLLAYVNNNLIGASDPISVQIADDGSFLTWVPLTTPGYVRISGDKCFFDVFLAPEMTLEVSFKWDEAVKYCRKKNKGDAAPENPFHFGGDLSRINKEVAEYPSVVSYGVYAMARDLTPSEAIDRMTADYESQIQAVDEYVKGKALDSATESLLKANVKSKHLFDVFEYARTREGLQRTDTSAASLKEPLDLKYFDHEKELLADYDKWILASLQYGGVANMMAHSPLLKLLGHEDHFVYDFGANAFPYLKSLGAALTPEEEEINEWLGEGCRKSCTLNELSQGMDSPRKAAERNGLKEQLNEFRQKQADRQSGQKVLLGDAPRNVRDISETIKSYLGVDSLPLLWQVALSEALRSRFQLKPDYYPDKSQLEDVVETIREDGEISHPAIIESLENFYRRAYARKSFDIPDDRRGRVIKDLIAPYAGKMLLIDFWGLSCGPCRYAIKNSVVAREKNRRNPDFKMIFISDDTESESQYRDFVTKYLEGEICYRIPESDFRMLRDLFAFSGIPRYVLIGRDGKVLDSDFNFHNMKRDMKGYGIELESDIMDEIASPVETE